MSSGGPAPHTQDAGGGQAWFTDPTVISVVAAICGAYVADALGDRPGWGLVGLVLGAAIPPLISSRGRGHGPRVVVGIGVAAIVAFLSVSVFDAATDRKPTLPGQPTVQGQGVADVAATPGPSPAPGGGFDRLTDGPLQITVTPRRLACSSETGCERTVMIANTGSANLAINTIEITGTNGGDFIPIDIGGCADRTIPPGVDPCKLEVRFEPLSGQGTRHALLEIHQKLDARSSQVLLTGTGQPVEPGPDLAAPVVVRCQYAGDQTVTEVRVSVVVQPPASGGTGLTTVPVDVGLEGAGGRIAGTAPVRDVQDGGGPDLVVPFTPDGGEHVLVLRTDPDRTLRDPEPDGNQRPYELDNETDPPPDTSCQA